MRPKTRCTAADREEGTSLVELMVFMALAAMVATMVGVTVVRGLHVQTDLTQRSALLDSARTAMQRTTRDIRDADRVVAATATSLVLERDSGNGTLRLTWALAAGQPAPSGPAGTSALTFTMGGTNPTGTTVPTTSQTVLLGVDPRATLFGYDPRSDYTPADATKVDQASCIITGSSPTAYAPECIGDVEIGLHLPATAGSPVHLADIVELRNAEVAP